MNKYPISSTCLPQWNSIRICQKVKIRWPSEIWMETALKAFAAVFILSTLLIIVFILFKGLPLFRTKGVGDFLFNLIWSPGTGSYGIGTMLVGSLAVTFSSMLWSVPMGLMTAIFMAEIAPARLAHVLSRMVELLAGIPSVVYGFFGLIVIVPFIREYFTGNGMSILAGAVVLGIMILPTVVNISRDAIVSVPKEYKEGSLALGATHYQSIWKVILPAARSGIITAIILGMGRAIGETMAVVMITGNSTVIPNSIFSPVRTMTSNIVLEMGYASGDHQAALFATGMVLFMFIIGINLIVNLAVKAGKAYDSE